MFLHVASGSCVSTLAKALHIGHTTISDYEATIQIQKEQIKLLEQINLAQQIAALWMQAEASPQTLALPRVTHAAMCPATAPQWSTNTIQAAIIPLKRSLNISQTIITLSSLVKSKVP